MIALCRGPPFSLTARREPPDPASTAVPSGARQHCLCSRRHARDPRRSTPLYPLHLIDVADRFLRVRHACTAGNRFACRIDPGWIRGALDALHVTVIIALINRRKSWQPPYQSGSALVETTYGPLVCGQSRFGYRIPVVPDLRRNAHVSRKSFARTRQRKRKIWILWKS
jgi:hypothetical protein